MKKFTVFAAILAVALCCLALGGCGTDDIDISSYAGEENVLGGIEEEEQTVTIADLKNMDCRTLRTHSTSDKIGNVKATGPELGTILEKYGLTKDDVDKVVFHGDDDYEVPLTGDYVREHDIYLAFGIDGEPLDAESAPCRVIIPESDSAYWIRMVNVIDFVIDRD